MDDAIPTNEERLHTSSDVESDCDEKVDLAQDGNEVDVKDAMEE